MSAATAGKPGRRAGATAGQWTLVAAPPHVAGRPVSRQRAVPGRVPAAPPRQRTGSAAPGRRVAAVPGQRVRAMAPGQSALTMPERTAGPMKGQRGKVVPGRGDNTADRRGRPGARQHRPALAVVPPQPAAAEERPEAPAPVRKPEMGLDEWERRAPRRAPQRPVQARRVRARPRTRLTRRGRIVVSALVIGAMLLVAVLAWMGGATRAEAAGSGSPPSAVYRNLAKVVVQPGESLWTIAAQAEPAADPRNVVQQIIDLNALGGSSIQPGERLWVPRS